MFDSSQFKVCCLRIFIVFASLTCTSIAQVPGSSRPAPVLVEILGQVRFAQGGAPAEKVLVRVEGFGSGVNGQMLTDSTGKFRFSGLGQATYIVTVRAPGYRELRQEVDLQTMPRAYLQFQLVPEKTETTPLPVAGNLVNSKIPPEAQKEFDTGRTMLVEEKKVEGGIAHLEKAVSLSPEFLDAHLLLGTAYMDTKQWEKAERELRKTLEIDSKATAAHFALGEVYRQQQKYAEAEKALQDGLKLDPKSHQGHFALGQVYFAKGDIAKAGPEVGQALQLKPDYAEAYLLAGNLFLRARNAANALQMFEEYLRLEPKGPLAAQTREMVEKIKKAMSEKKQ
jgi:tetratricopeptide (TPR) repeat protein